MRQQDHELHLPFQPLHADGRGQKWPELTPTSFLRQLRLEQERPDVQELLSEVAPLQQLKKVAPSEARPLPLHEQVLPDQHLLRYRKLLHSLRHLER